MDKLEEIKAITEKIGWYSHFGMPMEDIEWLISEVEKLRLDNTYLQQRLKREVEK